MTTATTATTAECPLSSTNACRSGSSNHRSNHRRMEATTAATTAKPGSCGGLRWSCGGLMIGQQVGITAAQGMSCGGCGGLRWSKRAVVFQYKINSWRPGTHRSQRYGTSRNAPRTARGRRSVTQQHPAPVPSNPLPPDTSACPSTPPVRRSCSGRNEGGQRAPDVRPDTRQNARHRERRSLNAVSARACRAPGRGGGR